MCGKKKKKSRNLRRPRIPTDQSLTLFTEDGVIEPPNTLRPIHELTGGGAFSAEKVAKTAETGESADY